MKLYQEVLVPPSVVQELAAGRYPVYVSGTMHTPKETVRRLLDDLPDNASLEDIQYHIYVCQKLDHGLTAADQGRVLTQDEVERRMARWLEQ